MKAHSLVFNLIGEIKADSWRDSVSVSEAIATKERQRGVSKGAAA